MKSFESSYVKYEGGKYALKVIVSEFQTSISGFADLNFFTLS